MDRLPMWLCGRARSRQSIGARPPHRRRILGCLIETWVRRLPAWRELVRGKRGRNRGRQGRMAAGRGRAAVDLPTYHPLNAAGSSLTHTHDRAAGPTQRVLIGLDSSLAATPSYRANMSLVTPAVTESCRNHSHDLICLIRNRRNIAHQWTDRTSQSSLSATQRILTTGPGSPTNAFSFFLPHTMARDVDPI